MTISIYPRSLIICIHLLLLCPGFILSAAMTPGAAHVPPDSFLVVSAKGQNLISKSGILNSSTWAPLLERLALSHPGIQETLLDANASGLNLQIPVQLFARIEAKDMAAPSFGIIVMAKDPSKADQTLAKLAEHFGMEKKKRKGGASRYFKKNFPLEIGRKGRLCFLLGIAPSQEIGNSVGTEERMLNFVETFLSKDPGKEFPASLKNHLNQSSDLALYLDGTGIAKIIEDFWPDDQWKKLLPALDGLFNRQLGVHLQSNPGSIRITGHEYVGDTENKKRKTSSLPMIGMIPDDSPLIVRWSIPPDSFKQSMIQSLDHALQFMSGGKLDKNSKLPGFDSSVSDILSFPSGDFVLAGGTFLSKIVPTSPAEDNLAESPTTLEPSFILGMGVDRPFALKQFMAGLKSAKTLDVLLDLNGLHLTDKGNDLWLSTFDFLREIKAGKPLVGLSKQRTKILNENSFALDLNISGANRAMRKLESLTYEQLKTLSILDDFTRLTLLTREKGTLTGTLKTDDKKKQGWEVAARHLGQQIIDAANQNLFRAIAMEDLNAVAEELKQGAMVNANDRFGHSPVHYAAFKGNARILQYLLRNGGDPNNKGRHESTPLHSAAWGRNMQALEVLLEEGAEVDARTDEGETPAMTAALRGEKDIIEVLFALSADPHAKDDHGTSLMDLAAAGGSEVVVKLLLQIGVRTENPLHVAAGLGDEQKIRKFLKNGRKVNELDSFGATPLLIAMVAGQEKMVDLLLSMKADPKISAREGYTLMHAAAFSGKKSMVRKALSLGFKVNARYGSGGITPTDVAEEQGDALPYLRALGGRTAWELGRRESSEEK